MLIFLISIFISFVFKALWYFAPFLFIFYLIAYVVRKFRKPIQKEPTKPFENRTQPTRKPNDDVLDVEFTVREHDDE